jgi:chromate transporter
MATVHVGANADPHPSIILVPPEGWPVPTEGRRASSTSTSSSGASAPFVPRGRTHCKPGRGWSGGWLARKDSNLQSPDPESGALPFGHSPAARGIVRRGASLTESAVPGAPNAEQATIGRISRYFLRLGTLGFGGPVALAGYMQRDLVEDRRWVSEQEYRDGLALAQMMPGPLAAQLGMWLAYVRTGVRGATIASLAFVAPPFVLVVAIAWIYVSIGGATWVGSLFYGVAPAAIAIIALAAYRLLPLTLGRDALLWLAALVVGLITYFTRSEIALAFIAAGLVIVAIRAGPDLLRRFAASDRPSPPRLPAAIGFLTPLFPAAAADPGLLGAIFLFFIEAGAFIFGSGLAIVPFLHQGVQHGWLTEQQFLDAVAVGLITPGPVVITAAFVGFIVAGLPGATVASLAVFLPAYLLVVLPGRWFLRYKDEPSVRAFVAGVSAAAAGAIVAASVILGQQAIRDATGGVIGLAALAALLAIRRWKPPVIERLSEPLVVAIAGVVGIALRGV